VSLPGVVPEGIEAPQPARLIDILPTIFSVCGLPAPEHIQGRSLLPVEFNAALFGDIDVRAETKALMEGTVLKSLRVRNLKCIHSPITNRTEFYHLAMDPREQHEDIWPDTAAYDDLRSELRRWMNRTENFWLIELRPSEQYTTFSATLGLSKGTFGVVVPVGFDLFGGDALTFNEELNRVRFSASALKPGKAFYFEVIPDDATVSFDLKIDEREAPLSAVVIDEKDPSHPTAMPFTLTSSEQWADPPFLMKKEKPSSVYNAEIAIRHFRSPAYVPGPPPPEAPRGPDEELMRQLRQSGYMQ